MSKRTTKKVHALRWAGLTRLSRSEVQALTRVTDLLGSLIAWGRWDSLDAGLQGLMVRPGSILVSSVEDVASVLAGLATTWRAENPAGRCIVLGADLYLAALLASAAAGRPAPAVVPRKISQTEAVVAGAAVAAMVHAASDGALHIVEACRAPQVCGAFDSPSAILEFGLGLAGGWGRGVAILELNFDWGPLFPGARPLSQRAGKRLVGLEMDAVIRSRTFLLAPQDLAALSAGAVLQFGAPQVRQALVMQVGDLVCSLAPMDQGGLGVGAFLVISVEAGEVFRGETMDEELRQDGYEEDSEGVGGDETDIQSVGEQEESQGDAPVLDPARLSGIELEASVELGKIRLSVSQVLGLGPGSVLELDRPIDETADLRVGGKLVAKGRLVDVEGKLGLQVTELLG